MLERDRQHFRRGPDPSKPEGQKYRYGISQFSWGPNTIYFHGGEIPGFNSKISYDPTNQLTLIMWTNLTVSLDGQQTANTLFVKMLDHVYVVSPLPPSPSPINCNPRWSWAGLQRARNRYKKADPGDATNNAPLRCVT